MKKFLFILLCVLAVAAGAPLVSGYKAEAALDQWVAYLNETPGYEVSWDYYQKGWLSTNAVMLVRFDNPIDLPMGQGADQGLVLPLHIHMKHGPVLVNDSFRQGWFSGRVIFSSEHEGLIKQFVNVEGDGPVYVANLFMDLSGDLHINDYSLPFTIDQAGERIRVESYSGGGVISLGEQVQYSGVLPSVRLQSQAGQVLLEGMSFSAEFDLGRLVAGTVAEGTTEIKLESIKTDLGDTDDFEIGNISLKTDVRFNKDSPTANIGIDMGFKKFISAQEHLSDAQISVALENVSFSFLEKYSEVIKQYGNLGGGGSGMLALQMSQLAATELLPHGPGVSINKLQFSSSEGALDFNGRIKISPEAAKKINNPMSAINDVVVNASGELDKTLAVKLTRKSAKQDLNNQLLQTGQVMSEEEQQKTVEQQANVQLSMLLLQGLLVEEGGKYILEFSFKDGAATLNGNAVPLPF